MKSNRVLKRKERREEMKKQKDEMRGKRAIKTNEYPFYRLVEVTKPIKKYTDRTVERALLRKMEKKKRRESKNG